MRQMPPVTVPMWNVLMLKSWRSSTGDGVVILNSQSIEQVLLAAIARREREAEIFRQLEAGKTTIEILSLPQWNSHGRKAGP
jgi:hypothetical protein